MCLKQFMFTLLIASGNLSLLAGCGGGGGSSPAAPSKAVLKLSTAPFAPYTTLAGVQVRVALPVGSSVATTTTGAVQSGVITPSGVLAVSGSVLFSSYSAPTTSVGGALKFFIVTPPGDNSFKVGEFATVVCGFSGAAPVKSSFALTLAATSTGGNAATANESFTLAIQ